MCGLIRFYCFKGGCTWIEDCTPDEAMNVRRRLRASDVTVTHSVRV